MMMMMMMMIPVDNKERFRSVSMTTTTNDESLDLVVPITKNPLPKQGWREKDTKMRAIVWCQKDDGQVTLTLEREEFTVRCFA